MIKRNNHGKLQVNGFYAHFLKIDFYKLFLNLLVLALFGLIIWSAIKLFSGGFLHSPLIGSLIFFVEIFTFVLLCRHARANKWRPPSIVVTTLVLIAMSVVMAFAGVQPMSSYKDNVISKWNTYWTEQKVKTEENLTKAKIEEEKGIEKQKKVSNINKVDKSAKMEREVLDLVNEIRKSKQITPLVWDNELYVYSKNHSQEMAEIKQLFHTKVGMPYAENCWGGEGSTTWNANTIVDGWMGSDFHRTWLLCPSLKYIAVGIVISDSGMYASWTFWVSEPSYSDWWYINGGSKPPSWWY